MHEAMIHASLIEDRRQSGHDRFDEVWDGVLHMVPQPTTTHQSIESEVQDALKAIVRTRGDLRVLYNLGVFDPAIPDYRNYRVPDIVVMEPRHLSKRGVEGNAALVVEILSPDDESRDKLPFYARVGVREVWLIDPQAASVEVLVLGDDGYRAAPSALGLRLEVIDRRLRIHDGDAVSSIDLRDRV